MIEKTLLDVSESAAQHADKDSVEGGLGHTGQYQVRIFMHTFRSVIE